MYDICNKESFINLTNNWFSDVKKNLDDFKCIIVGNKFDLEDFRTVSEKQARDFAEKKGVAYIEASAKDSTNVREIFKNLADQLSS